MRALVLVAHPSRDGFAHAAADAACDGLTDAGHEIDRIDLTADGYRPAMNRDERIAYETDDPILDPEVADHVARLRRAEILVFVYPTWWSGQPALLKGWLERTMVPGVAFAFDERTGKVRPALHHIRRIVGVTTWGSSRWYAWAVNDNGRRVLTRALRLTCGWRTPTTWLAMYGMDRSTETDRQQFLDRVRARTARL